MDEVSVSDIHSDSSCDCSCMSSSDTCPSDTIKSLKSLALSASLSSDMGTSLPCESTSCTSSRNDGFLRGLVRLGGTLVDTV